MIDNYSVQVLQGSCTPAAGAKFCNISYIIIYFVCAK